MIALAVVFWLCFALCVYVYFGYPALLLVVSKLRPKPARRGDVTPRASFIVAAYNEEGVIAQKIENTLSLDYPADAIEVLVAANGCVDRTCEIVRGFTDPRVKLIEVERPGKMGAVNEAVRHATGEMLVFSDADFYLDAHTLRLMASYFADPEVGGVCGARKPGAERKGDATAEGEGMYTKWDKWQKAKESEIGSVFAADGLLYAIRRDLYVPMTNPNLSDDISVSTKIPLAGYRLLFDRNATAWENATVETRAEFRRKIRVANRAMKACMALGSRLFTTGFYGFEVLSHKLVRHFVPLFLIPMLIVSVPLAMRSRFFAVMLAGQLAVYVLGALGAMVRQTPLGRWRIFSVPYYFCFVNTCALFAIFRLFRGQQTAAWSTRAAVG